MTDDRFAQDIAANVYYCGEVSRNYEDSVLRDIDGSFESGIDFAPLAPESTEFKYYLPGVGFVLALGLEDGELTGEREELVCFGDSLEVLEDESCGIEDPEALLDELCELHSAFCQD